MSVGIQHRNDDDDEALQLVDRRLVAGRGQRVEELGSGLRRAYFGRVDACADGDDGFVRRGQPPRFVDGERAWVGELLVGRANLFEVADVVRGGDDCRDRTMAFGRGADVHELDAIGRGCDRLKIFLDVVGSRESAIDSKAEPELRVRSGQAGGLLSGDDTRQQRQRENDGACAHAPS